MVISKPPWTVGQCCWQLCLKVCTLDPDQKTSYQIANLYQMCCFSRYQQVLLIISRIKFKNLYLMSRNQQYSIGISPKLVITYSHFKVAYKCYLFRPLESIYTVSTSASEWKQVNRDSASCTYQFITDFYTFLCYYGVLLLCF